MGNQFNKPTENTSTQETSTKSVENAVLDPNNTIIADNSIATSSTVAPVKPAQTDYYILDTFTKQQIVDYLKKQGRLPNLQIENNFSTLVKDVNLVTTNLLSVSVEMYEKIKIALQNQVIKPDDKPQSFSSKKLCFIKPTFTPEHVKKDILNKKEIFLQNKDTTLDPKLYDILDQIKPSDISNITLAEFNEAFRDGVSTTDMFGVSKKLLNHSPDYFKLKLLGLYNKLFKLELSVKQVSLGKASFVYKESKNGPKDDINSFRQIVAVHNTINHFHRILALRLNSYLDKNNYIDKTIQKGAMAGIKNGLLEHIFKLKQVIKDSNKNKKPLAIIFVDISNAFGSVKLNKLFEIMALYKIDNTFINYIKDFYKGFEYYFQTKDWSTELFEWTDGLVQGCPMSPILFVLVMNYILVHLDKNCKATHGYKLLDTTSILLAAFIDDIAIVCNSLENAVAVFDKLKVLLATVGLSLNISKCAYMMVNQEGKVIEGFTGVPEVKVFKYLGEYISNDGTTCESYTQFISMLGKKLSSLDRKKISLEIKRKFFSKCMLPWIQRKMIAMYDITKTERGKIIYVLKKYLDKWGGDNSDLNIFNFIGDALKDSEDEVIKSMDLDEETSEFDDILKQDIKQANSCIRSNMGNVTGFTYDKINKDPNVDKAGDDSDSEENEGDGVKGEDKGEIKEEIKGEIKPFVVPDIIEQIMAVPIIEPVMNAVDDGVIQELLNK